MNREEESRLPATVAEAVQDLQRLTLDDVDLHVLAIGEVDEPLLRIVGEVDVPGRALRQGRGRDDHLFHEGAIGLEYRDPVRRTITYVEQAIDRELGAVHRWAELLWRGLARHVPARILAGHGGVAIGTPEALHLTGAGVEDRHPSVEVAVGDIGLVFHAVDEDLGHSAEARLVVAVGRKAAAVACPRP